MFLVFCPSLLPSLLRTGGVVVLGCRLQGLERRRGSVSPPSFPCLWCWGRQLPVATTSWGHECRACRFLLFPPEFRLIAIAFSANVAATPEEAKRVHSVIEDLVQCQLKPKKCFHLPKRRLDVRRRRCAREADRQLLCLQPARPASPGQLPSSPLPLLGLSICIFKERAVVVHVQYCNLQKQNYCARHDIYCTLRFLVALCLCMNRVRIKT